MSFLIYLIGYFIFIAGVAWGLTVAGVPSIWVGVGCVILLGLGIISAVTATRRKDPVEGEAGGSTVTVVKD